jgi:hypothetical protein
MRCLKFIFSPIRNAGDSGFRMYIIGMKEDSEYDDARGAASAHPAAVRAEVRPYAVAHHLPAAPPPKQQPALQTVAYPAHHGSRCEQRDLRARVSGQRDAVKTGAQQSCERKAPLTATPLLLELTCCSSDAERLREALQACIQKSLLMILALRLTVDAKRCDVVRQRVADESRRKQAARFIYPAACACSPHVNCRHL